MSRTSLLAVGLAFLLARLAATCVFGSSELDHRAGLKEIFKDHFLIGAALNRRQFYEEDSVAGPLIKAHFNSVTPENALKWGLVHPQPDRYDFEPSDRYVAFGEKNQMFIIGHTLV